MISRHRQLLRGFFVSLHRCLPFGSDARIYVTTKISSDGYSDMWQGLAILLTASYDALKLKSRRGFKCVG
jgi:hypothetical protein